MHIRHANGPPCEYSRQQRREHRGHRNQTRRPCGLPLNPRPVHMSCIAIPSIAKRSPLTNTDIAPAGEASKTAQRRVKEVPGSRRPCRCHWRTSMEWQSSTVRRPLRRPQWPEKGLPIGQSRLGVRFGGNWQSEAVSGSFRGASVFGPRPKLTRSRRSSPRLRASCAITVNASRSVPYTALPGFVLIWLPALCLLHAPGVRA